MKNKISKIVIGIARYVFLLSFSYVLLYPLLYILAHTFQGSADYFDPTVQWVSKTFTLENIRWGVKTIGFFEGLRSTVFVQVVSALIQVVSCGFAAYGLSRFKFKGRSFAIALLFVNILVPSSMTIIPNYINFHNVDLFGIIGLINRLAGTEFSINLLNTPWVFYLPAAFGVGLQSGIVIYIFMQFFKSFPRELEEASWIDGLTPFGSFIRVVVPSSGVVILTVTIFSVVWHWNEYYLPSMYLVSNQPLAVKIYNIFTLFTTSMDDNVTTALIINSAMATILLFMLPMLIMFVILQKKFIKSVTQSGIVG